MCDIVYLTKSFVILILSAIVIYELNSMCLSNIDLGLSVKCANMIVFPLMPGPYKGPPYAFI